MCMCKLTTEHIESLIKLATFIGAFILMGYALCQLRKTTVSTMDTIREQADQIPGKRLLIKKALWDYDILIAGVLVVVAGALGLIENQTFAVFLGAVLGGLGLKIAKDFNNKDE